MFFLIIKYLITFCHYNYDPFSGFNHLSYMSHNLICRPLILGQ
ncbi:hypothetical protein OPIT5_05085 [Opitutaceae bacterium TAV5]|nr:hypothetical protein OPIT5_05085 [Opitutaceae bacterium TAV5]